MKEKNKILFRKMKIPERKTKVVAMIVLASALTIVMTLPCMWWQVPSGQLAIWVLIMIMLVDGLLWLAMYDHYAQSENEKYKMYESKQDKISAVEGERNRLKNEVKKQKEELQELQDENENIAQELARLQQENERLRGCEHMLREIYTCSQIEEVRAYARECVSRENCLDLFEPITYIKNPNYARVIENNIELLYGLITQPKVGIFGREKSNDKEVRDKIKELLKGGKGGAGGTSIPVLTRDRETLKKIDNDVER